MTSANTPKTFPLNLPEGDAELLLDELQARLREGRRLFAEVGQILAEIESRGVRDLYGYESIAVFYEHVARVTRAKAKRVTDRAIALNSRRTRDGTSTPPVAPLTGAAAAQGVLADSGIDRIVTVMRRLPAHVAASARLDAEQRLVNLASVARPRAVTTAGTALIAQLDPKGNDTEDPTPQATRREFWLRQKRTGRWDVRGDLDSETGYRLNALLVPLAHSAPSGEADHRTPAERRGDAFAEIVDLAESGPDIPMPRRGSARVYEEVKQTEPPEAPPHGSTSDTQHDQPSADQTGRRASEPIRTTTVDTRSAEAAERSRGAAHIRPPRWWSRISKPRSGKETSSTTHQRVLSRLPGRTEVPLRGPETA